MVRFGEFLDLSDNTTCQAVHRCRLTFQAVIKISLIYQTIQLVEQYTGSYQTIQLVKQNTGVN